MNSTDQAKPVEPAPESEATKSGTATSDGVVRIGVLGCGNVGSELVRLVGLRAESILARTGIALEIVAIGVRDAAKVRPGIDASLLTADVAGIVTRDDVDLVVELIGGIEPALGLIEAAFKNGKPVVTGNKELLANRGHELFQAADEAEVDLLFEAAVGGGIPLIRPMRESLVAEDVSRVMGIVNGTTNYILSQMAENGATYADALAQAQALGFAEAEPSADVDGYDAASKAAILASIAFGQQVTAADVDREGITGVNAADVDYATKHRLVIKLLAVAEINEAKELAVRVSPVLLPRNHPLASVSGSYNAVFVEGKAVGSLMFYGRGAGGSPTASAVLGDVVDAAVNLRKQTHASIGTFAPANFADRREAMSQYCLSIHVADQPGVLAAVAGVFAAHEVSIKSMEQEGFGNEAHIVFVTHVARHESVQQCLKAFATISAVDSIGSVFRVLS